MPDSTVAVPLFVGNDLALDFINTVYGPVGARADVLLGDDSVVAWLQAAGVLREGVVIQPPQGLAAVAVALRQEAQFILSRAQEGKPFDAAVVNQLLDEGRPTRRLESGSANPQLIEQRRTDSAAGLLEPVAAALAGLLSGGDLQQVRQCEAHDCTLVFHDTTKSKRRRWCSMAQCGNRMKVAAYRSRQHKN